MPFKYKVESTNEFIKQFQKLTKKDSTLRERLRNKIKKITDDPETGEPKKYKLKYTRGEHVDPFVIVYMILNDTILFLYVEHHQCVYDETPKVFKDIEEEFPELWIKMSPQMQRYLKSWK